MKVDKSTVEKMAHLSRLYFDAQDEAKMLDSMNNIIGWMDKLSQVDTAGVEPLTHMSQEVNAWREDEIKNQLSREKGLLNAPNKDSNYFRVPKVIE